MGHRMETARDLRGRAHVGPLTNAAHLRAHVRCKLRCRRAGMALELRPKRLEDDGSDGVAGADDPPCEAWADRCEVVIMRPSLGIAIIAQACSKSTKWGLRVVVRAMPHRAARRRKPASPAHTE